MTGPDGDGNRLALAASQMIGTRFRLHGRDPATGLDCIGLVHASLIAIGRTSRPPEGYRLRNSEFGRWLKFAELSGFVPVDDGIAAGDVVLTYPGPGQQHLLICEGKSTAIHAHAGLGRVVRQQFAIEDDLGAHWRLI